MRKKVELNNELHHDLEISSCFWNLLFVPVHSSRSSRGDDKILNAMTISDESEKCK